MDITHVVMAIAALSFAFLLGRVTKGGAKVADAAVTDAEPYPDLYDVSGTTLGGGIVGEKELAADEVVGFRVVCPDGGFRGEDVTDLELAAYMRDEASKPGRRCATDPPSATMTVFTRKCPGGPHVLMEVHGRPEPVYVGQGLPPDLDRELTLAEAAAGKPPRRKRHA